MAQWAVIIPADRWATERLFQHETLTVAGSPAVKPLAGDEVLLLAGGDRPLLAGGDRPLLAGGGLPQAVALGVVAPESDTEAFVVRFTRRAFDEPVPAGELQLDADQPVTAVEPEVFQRLAARLGGDRARERRTWLVSVALPIEATNQAEAVRQFWSHVLELGPAELPAYVWPSGDELAMQAFVLGAEANQDPEEDGEED